jgi:hypothetical protein
MQMLNSYQDLVCGHADDGRGDIIWRGISIPYLKDIMPKECQAHMDRIQWWYDLSRRPSGAFGISSCVSFDDEASGAATALAYTAPLKTLRITGAPRSKYAKDFTLPGQLWGRKMDLDFLSIENGKSYGADEQVHVAYFKLSDESRKAKENFAKISREEMLKNIYHRSYYMRVQAAKALFSVGALDELEKLLQDKDTRVRRAAIDGLVDRTGWAADDRGKDKISSDKVTPGMIASIRKMLADPDEAIYTVDGALALLSCSPPAAIAESLSLIQPWTTHEDWWLRHRAFTALAAAAEDETIAPKVLGIMGDILSSEDRSAAHTNMTWTMWRLAGKHKANNEIKKQISAVFMKAVKDTKIEPGFRNGAGGFYLKNDFIHALSVEPNASLELAKSLKKRFPDLRIDYLVESTGKLLEVQGKLPDADKPELVELLYGDYRQEFIRRMNAGDMRIDTISALVKLKDKNAGWRVLGPQGDREWRYMSFNPLPKDAKDLKEMNRMRDVTLPEGMANWFASEFDDNAWKKGKAPIGIGKWSGRLDPYTSNPDASFESRSDWGDGEFLVMRTEFEIDSLDYDYFQLRMLALQGHKIYLNGHEIRTSGSGWRTPEYKGLMLGPDAVKYLKKGKNVLAVCTVLAYAEAFPPRRRATFNTPALGQMDLYLEGLNKADIMGTAEKK